jgi:hypothetical protein
LNDKGELVKDANGRLIRGPLNRIVVMEKRTVPVPAMSSSGSGPSRAAIPADAEQ